MKPLSGMDEFERLVRNEAGWCLLDFWGPNCAPCVGLHETLRKLADEFSQIRFFSINADEELDIAASLGVRGLPTLILFCDGMEKKRWFGSVGHDALATALKNAVGP